MKVKEIIEELSGLDPELEVSVHTRIREECSCPEWQEYCYCDSYRDETLYIGNISKETEYNKKKKKQIVTGIVFNC